MFVMMMVMMMMMIIIMTMMHTKANSSFAKNNVYINNCFVVINIRNNNSTLKDLVTKLKHTNDHFISNLTI